MIINEVCKETGLTKKVMREFYECSGYYEIFIPNMKILSKAYKEYSENKGIMYCKS